MNEQKNIPLKGDRFLENEMADSMLSVALGKGFRAPICSNAATTHAAGCSIVAFIGRAMRANLNFLSNQVDICRGELMCEQDFSVEKLQEHIDILGALNLSLYLVTSERVLSLEANSVNENAETENVLAQAFGKLPKDDIQVYGEGISVIRSMLENEILLEMMKLRDDMLEHPEDDRAEEMRELLHLRIAPKLLELHNGLRELSSNVGQVVRKVMDDWELDLRQISESGTCASAARNWWIEQKRK
jgi:hypothetical protein